MQPPTLSPIPVSLDRAHLAFELATGMTSVPDVLARYKIQKHHLKLLLKQDAQFRHQYNDYKREWGAPKNAKERLRLKAQLAAEDGLLTLYSMFNDPDIGATQRIEAYKQICTLADVAPKKDAVPDGQRFSITINLGDGPQDRLTITQEPTHEEADQV